MKIVGTGSCLPQRVVSNDDLAAIMDTSDEWISSRTGIRNRHIATTETTTSLACDAVKSALQDAGIDGSEIDLIIAASVSTDKIVPSLACQIQAEIGAGSAVAFDINAACSVSPSTSMGNEPKKTSEKLGSMCCRACNLSLSSPSNSMRSER